jgi:hypothetical protein
MAWVQVVQLRGGQVTAVMIVATIALVCGPVGATAILLALGKDLLPSWLFPMTLLLMWGVCGYLLFVLFRQGMSALGQLKRPADFVPRGVPNTNGVKVAAPSETATPRVPSEHVQEGWYARQEMKSDT